MKGSSSLDISTWKLLSVSGKYYGIIHNLINDSKSGEGEGFSQPNTSNNDIGMLPGK